MKKLLSVLLVAVMLVTSFSLVASAESASTTSYTFTGSYNISSKTTVSPELFNIAVSIDSSKIAALDGESKAYTYTIDSVVANGIDYLSDKEAFFAAFESEDYSGTVLEVTVTMNFESDKVFGTLNYTVNVTGFMAPVSVGLGPVDDALAGVSLPVDVSFSDTVWQFPTIDEIEVIQKPTRQEYDDSEKFDFEGTTILVKTKVATSYEEVPDDTGALQKVYNYEEGYTGLVEYGPQTSNMFSANPSKDENLSIHVNEVIAYFDGIEIVKLPVKVVHAGSNGYVSITNDFVTEGKPGYHALVCNGCGEAHDPQPHNPSPVLDENGEPVLDENGDIVYWTYNNDQSFINNGTESSICSDCGAVLTRNTFGTADYNDVFGNIGILQTVFDCINTIIRLIQSAF